MIKLTPGMLVQHVPSRDLGMIIAARADGCVQIMWNEQESWDDRGGGIWIADEWIADEWIADEWVGDDNITAAGVVLPLRRTRCIELIDTSC